jgi:hypothetical protein
MRINLTTPLSDDKERQRRNEVILAAIERHTEERMNDEYGRIHTDGSRSGGQPMPATEKAHKAIIEVLAEWGIEPRSTTPEHFAVATTEALCRAIDQQEDLRQPAQSDVNERLGAWLSAALDDPNCSDAFKQDINDWFANQPTQSDALQAENEQLRHDLERLRVEAQAQFDRGYYDGCTHPLEKSK